MIRPILTYTVGADDNPPVLQEETRRVTDLSSEEVTSCIRDLTDTLTDFISRNGNKRGISGLSAPQIGSDLAISVVQTTEKLYVMINPAVTEELGKQRLFRIGCFSLFEYRALVHYNDDVIIEFSDENGIPHREEFKGDRSCVMQHEIDHLRGWLLFERLPNKEADLFIPGEIKKDSDVPVTRRYSSLFNDYTDYAEYIRTESVRHTGLIDAVREYSVYERPILEIGNGPSAASVELSGLGYDVTCVQADRDMLDLDVRINESCGTSVRYMPADEIDETLIYDTAFSDEYFRPFYEDELTAEITEWACHCRTLIIGCLSESQKKTACETFSTNNCRLVILD